MSRLHQDDGAACEGQKVCLATTAYDKPEDTYTFSLASSREALHQAGIQTAYYLLHGNCHVDDARNRIVQEFLLSDCTDLVFLDADVSWQAKDLVKLCQHDADIIGAVYPFRREDKKDDMPVRMLPGAVAENGLLEVEGLPTGFLRIKRHVIETLAAQCESFDGNNGHDTMTPLLFQRTLIAGTRWGGDLNFCNLWRAQGGKILCDPEITFGHTAKIVFKDSMGAFLRRAGSLTLKHVADKIRAGTWTLDDLHEAKRYDDNKFGVDANTLMIAVKAAEQADGPIIEAGSGLTTILMAAATEQTVFCLEHHPGYAQRLRIMAAQAGVGNIGLCACPIVDRWYDIEGKTLPERFALGVNDGPPRSISDRAKFLDVFGGRVDSMIIDDTDDPAYRSNIESWAKVHQFTATSLGTRVMVMRAA